MSFFSKKPTVERKYTHARLKKCHKYEERLKTLNLPTLAHRRRRDDMIQTFKMIKGLEDIPEGTEDAGMTKYLLAKLLFFA